MIINRVGGASASFNGNATVNDVIEGKTFYSDDKNMKTGSLVSLSSFSRVEGDWSYSEGSSGYWSDVAVSTTDTIANVSSNSVGCVVRISSSSNIISYSKDSGLTWTDITAPVTGNAWNSITFGGDRYSSDGIFVAIAPNSNKYIYSNNGSSWSSGNLPVSTTWSSICGGSKFVAVSKGTNICASFVNEYNTAVQGTLPIVADWSCVCFGGGLYVAVAESCAYSAYSTDGGATWSLSSALPSNSSRYSVCYGDGKFVAVGDYNSFMYSYDGRNWSSTTTPVSSGVYYSVCYGNGKFIATKRDQSNINSLYSYDGIEWFVDSELPFSAPLTSICYGFGKFIAVSYNNTKVFMKGNYNVKKVNEVASYTYAINPTVIIDEDSPVFPNDLQVAVGVVDGESRYVAVSRYSSSTGVVASVRYSSDGVTWSDYIALPSTSTTSSSYIKYVNNKFIVYGYEFNSVDSFYISDDGISWTAVSLPVSKDWRGVTYGNGRYVAVANNSMYGAYSYDGITWIQTAVGSSNKNLYGVTFGCGEFLAYGSASTAVITLDGITWKDSSYYSGSSGVAHSSGKDLGAYYNNKFVVVAQDSNVVYYSYTSRKGYGWFNESEMPPFGGSDKRPLSVVCGGGVIIAPSCSSSTSSSDKVLISEDGDSWDLYSFIKPSNNNSTVAWKSVCYSEKDNEFIAISGKRIVKFCVIYYPINNY